MSQCEWQGKGHGVCSPLLPEAPLPSFSPSGLWGCLPPCHGERKGRVARGRVNPISIFRCLLVSSLSGKIATLHHVNSECHRTRKLEPSTPCTPPRRRQNSVAGDFLPPAAVIAFFPSPKPACAESACSGFVAHLSLAVSGVGCAMALVVLAVAVSTR